MLKIFKKKNPALENMVWSEHDSLLLDKLQDRFVYREGVLYEREHKMALIQIVTAIELLLSNLRNLEQVEKDIIKRENRKAELSGKK